MVGVFPSLSVVLSSIIRLIIRRTSSIVSLLNAIYLMVLMCVVQVTIFSC